MAVLNMQHPWAFTFGLLGNLISFMVYLAPLPTFYRIYKKKSTKGFQSVPYLVALFSAMLWIFYAFLKTNSYLLITINMVGCFIETIYIVMFIIYAPRKVKISTAKLFVLLNVGAFSLILVLTLLLSKGYKRAQILGWVCVGFSVSVFAAPLSIMRLVIQTKSVEFMPFSLSFFLTVSAVVWFGYGLVTKDIYVALPNILGSLFGVGQMVLYVIYKNTTQSVIQSKDPEKTSQDYKLPELGDQCCQAGNNRRRRSGSSSGSRTISRGSETADYQERRLCLVTSFSTLIHSIVPCLSLFQ